MTNYRSLIGGFFSSTPFDKNVGPKNPSGTCPVSVRMNNPGALNDMGPSGAIKWVQALPGYVGGRLTTPGNRTAIFETPEHGVAAWFELMRRYRASKFTTVGGIINHYGGGQNYSSYIKSVTDWTGFRPDKEVVLNTADKDLLTFAKAMFRLESGMNPIPWTDAQILFGFALVDQRDAQNQNVVAGTVAGAVLTGAVSTGSAAASGLSGWAVAAIALAFLIAIVVGLSLYINRNPTK